MPLDTPEGPIALAEQRLADMLADCPAFQAFVGVADETDPVAAAKGKIFHDEIPPPADGDVYELEEMLGHRPCAIVWTEPTEGYSMTAEANSGDAFDFGEAGKLGFCLDWTIPEDIANDEAKACRKMRNHVGKIMADLTARAGTSGFLAFHRIALVEGPMRTHPESRATHGDLMVARLTVEWDCRAGGGA